MKKHGILIDGEGVVDGGATKILLQIFSKSSSIGRAMTVSGRAISRRFSSRSRKTRSGAAC
jgi:hypothetical protein